MIWTGFYSSLQAQTDPLIEGSNIRPFTASGSVGLSANTYSAWGIQNRRAPASLQSNANMNFTMFGFSSGLNLLYSTDQSELRQNFNNISFNANWKWLTVQAGDVNPNFSEYGINGATIRGGYIKVEPGSWLLEFSGGRSKRKVEVSPKEGFREPAFERWSMAGKIGYDSDDSHFFLSTHYSLDKDNSLDNPGIITPQENLTVTPDVKVTFFDKTLSLTAQVTASAFTRDLNTPEIPAGSAGMPTFLSSIIQGHTSSRINYAGEAAMNLDLDKFGLELGYERIQPGFTSLGVGRVRDDQQKIRISPSVQLFNNKLTLQSSVSLGRDNLLGSRIQTQRNTTIGTNFQLQLTDRFTVSGNYNLLVNDVSSTSEPDTALAQGIALDRKQVANTFMLQPTFTFQKAERTHNISLTGSYYTLTNELEGSSASGAGGLNFDTYSTSVSYSLTFPSGFSVNTMGNFLVNSSNFSKNTSVGGNVGASYALFDRKLTLSANGKFNQNINETMRSGSSGSTVKARQLMFNLMGNYRFSSKDSFSLSVRSRNNSVVQGGSSSYSELEGNFKYQHRF